MIIYDIICFIGRGLEWNSHSNPASRCFFCPCPWRFSRPNADVAQGWCGPGRRQEISPGCRLPPWHRQWKKFTRRGSWGVSTILCQFMSNVMNAPTHWSKAIIFVGHPPLLGWPILQVFLGHAFVTFCDCPEELPTCSGRNWTPFLIAGADSPGDGVIWGAVVHASPLKDPQLPDRLSVRQANLYSWVSLFLSFLSFVLSFFRSFFLSFSLSLSLSQKRTFDEPWCGRGGPLPSPAE